MCRRVDCGSCHKPTFAGCGAHVEQVLGNVAPADRCRCREDKAQARADKPATGGSPWFRNLFGK